MWLTLTVGRPTVRQVYALAAAACERLGEEFPATFHDASELIQHLRLENGHPRPFLEDTTRRRRTSRRAEDAWPRGFASFNRRSPPGSFEESAAVSADPFFQDARTRRPERKGGGTEVPPGRPRIGPGS